MYPVLFRIGDFEITSFGVTVGVAALVERGARDGERAAGPVGAVIGGVIGGLVGAKLLWTIEFSGQQPIGELLFSRGGLSWFGGLIGGVGTGLWLLHRHKVPLVCGLAAATPALAIGHAIGRVGCFLVGDDYGRPTDLPWGIAFPNGLPPTDVPVHPTQLYETIALTIGAWLLHRWRGRGVPDAAVLGRYLVLAGAVRFGIEFIRVNLRVLGPLTLAQLISLSLIIAGTGLLITSRDRGLLKTERI